VEGILRMAAREGDELDILVPDAGVRLHGLRLDLERAHLTADGNLEIAVVDNRAARANSLTRGRSTLVLPGVSAWASIDPDGQGDCEIFDIIDLQGVAGMFILGHAMTHVLVMGSPNKIIIR
jgi:hypothetical protein